MMKSVKAIIEKEEIQQWVREISGMIEEMIGITPIVLPVVGSHDSPLRIIMRQEYQQQC